MIRIFLTRLRPFSNLLHSTFIRSHEKCSLTNCACNRHDFLSVSKVKNLLITLWISLLYIAFSLIGIFVTTLINKRDLSPSPPIIPNFQQPRSSYTIFLLALLYLFNKVKHISSPLFSFHTCLEVLWEFVIQNWLQNSLHYKINEHYIKIKWILHRTEEKNWESVDTGKRL